MPTARVYQPRWDKAASPCPVCGARIRGSTQISHIGSDRCLLKMQRELGGLCADPRGGRALELVRELAKLLAGGPV